MSSPKSSSILPMIQYTGLKELAAYMQQTNQASLPAQMCPLNLECSRRQQHSCRLNKCSLLYWSLCCAPAGHDAIDATSTYCFQSRAWKEISRREPVATLVQPCVTSSPLQSHPCSAASALAWFQLRTGPVLAALDWRCCSMCSLAFWEGVARADALGSSCLLAA